MNGMSVKIIEKCLPKNPRDVARPFINRGKNFNQLFCYKQNKPNKLKATTPELVTDTKSPDSNF